MSYLGLDIGTTGCKAAVFDETGRQRALAYREYPVLSPHPGWAELDSRDVCAKCFQVITEAAGACAADPIRGIGISSQGEAFTPVGKESEILGNAMISSDSRATTISREFPQQFGGDRLYRKTGHTASSIFTLFKLLWLKEHQAGLWTSARRFLCFEDLLHLQLGLDPAIGYPLAGRTMLFNVVDHAWDDEICAAIDLDPAKLARPLSSGSVVGEIPAHIAARLGLPRGVVVVAGGHDQSCSALGVGVTGDGAALYGMGTVDCIAPAFDNAVFTKDLFESNLCTYDYTCPSMYTTVAYSLTGGNILKWFRDELSGEEMLAARSSSRSVYDHIFDLMQNRPSPLLVLPYFTPSGTPWFDATTPGAIVGLRLTTKRHEILRALLEGVAFEMRLNLSILERCNRRIRELRASGGGAKNDAFVQLKADVLDTPISISAVTEAGCLGAAMLAQAAVERRPISQVASASTRATRTLEPRRSMADYYRGRFDEYCRLYESIRGFAAGR